MSTTQVPQLVDDSRTRKVNALLAWWVDAVNCYTYSLRISPNRI
ncbi:hypothetical protein [Nostoc sp.]